MELNRIERAALEAFSTTYGDDIVGLRQQLQSVSVDARENTGGGFFTDISVADSAGPVTCPSPLDRLVVRIDGVLLEFLLFFETGKAHLLEAYAVEGVATDEIDFDTAPFGDITLAP